MKQKFNRFLAEVLTVAVLLTSVAFMTLADSSDFPVELIVSEDTVINNNNAAWDRAYLYMKHGYTHARHILLKFDYSNIDLTSVEKIYLNLYSVCPDGLSAQETVNEASIYWSADTSWTENDTSYSKIPSDMVEVGNKLISLPKLSPNSEYTNQYYAYDVTSAIDANTNASKQITFIIWNETESTESSNCGLGFAAREDTTTNKPAKLVFEGAESDLTPPSSPIRNGEVVPAKEDTMVKTGTGASGTYGRASNLTIATSDENSLVSSALMKFDLSGYTADEIAGAGQRQI